MRSLIACGLLGVMLGVVSCSSGSKPGGDAGGTDSAAIAPLACYTASMFICDEYPNPTAAQDSDVPVRCSSVSGVLSRPPACPTAGFLGKCTLGSGKGAYVQRFYTGADATYSQDFCVNTSLGIWSTTF
jgi:hypothetical protein